MRKTPVSVCPLRQQTLRPPTHCCARRIHGRRGCYLVVGASMRITHGCAGSLEQPDRSSLGFGITTAVGLDRWRCSKCNWWFGLRSIMGADHHPAVPRPSIPDSCQTGGMWAVAYG